MTIPREDIEAMIETWEHRAAVGRLDSGFQSGTLMCATDLQNLLRKFCRIATTEPGEPPSDGEPEILPPMRSPRVPTFTPEDT